MASPKTTLTGFNASAFVKKDDNDMTISLPVIADDNPTAAVPAKTTKKKSTKKSEASSSAVAVPTAKTSMDYVAMNVPYEQSYRESETMLNEIIAQANAVSMDLMSDLQMIRASKILKNKNGAINATTENLIAAMQAKLAAIRDKTKIMDNIHNLELKRVKDLKIDATDTRSDEQKIAEMYNAFITTTIGGNPMSQLGPSPLSMMMNPTQYPSQQQIAIGTSADNADAQNWEAGLNPAQRRMLLSAQNKLNIVVLYDENTGNRRFAALDSSSGQEIPNVELPSESPYDLDLNPNMGTAKSRRLQVVYPLVIIHSPSMQAY